MVAVVIKNTLYRVFLPISLIIAALIRPSLVSAVYAILALLNPLFPRIRASYPLSTATKIFLSLTVVTSLLFAIGQLAYQITEHVVTIDDVDYVEDCKTQENNWRYWMRQVGFTRVPGNGTVGFRFMLPEVITLLSSLGTLIICLTKHESVDLNEPSGPVQAQHSHVSNTGSGYARSVRSAGTGRYGILDAITPSLQRLSDIVLTLFTVFIGIIQPSLLNSVYFILFLILLTWYSVYIPLGRNKFNGFKKFLIGYSGVHLLLLYLYQIEFIKKLLEPDHLAARLVGLTDLASPAPCDHWWDLYFNSYWTAYVNFIALWIYYFCTVSQYKWTRTGIRHLPNDIEDDTSSDHEEFYQMNDLSTNRNIQENDEHRSDGLLPSSSDVEQGPNSIPLQRITSAVLDRQKISVIFRRPGEKETVASEGLTAVTFFCLHHCYVFGLIAMMTWALLYHSVFGLIFLFTACVLWALRDSRKWCFRISPVLLLYVEFLLIAQYIYSLDLIAGKELPVNSALQIVGFQPAASRSAAFLTLAVKIILSLPFFILLRLKLRENYYDSLSEHDRRKRLNYGTFSQPSDQVTARRSTNTSSDSKTTAVFNFVSHYLTKFWIFVVAFVLLVNALSSPPVDYTAGYLILWCLLILLLHISFRFFRRIVFVYWTFVIIYSSILLIAVYTYQFPSVPEFWQNELGLSAETFAKIGLVDYRDEHNSSLLFVRLLLPILVVLVTMLQLKFFHDPWTKLVQTPNHSEAGSIARSGDETSSSAIDMSGNMLRVQYNTAPRKVPAQIRYVYPEGYVEIHRPRKDSRELINGKLKKEFSHKGKIHSFKVDGNSDPEIEPVKYIPPWKTAARTALQKVRAIFADLVEVLWRLVEVHLTKLILLILIITAASHICVLNLVLVVFVSVAVCLPGLAGLISLLLTVYLALSTVARVVYLIHWGQSSNATDFITFGDGDCPELGLNGTSAESVPQWLGLGAITSVFERDVVGLVLLLVTIAIQLSVKYRQRHNRRLRGLPEPPSDVIFPGEDGQYVDKSLIHCVKFMFNYFFYKFGLEMSMIMMAIVAWVRMDLLGLIIIGWLFVLVLMPRRFNRALWPILLLYLAIMLPLQYAMWIGLPQDLCLLYPWSNWLVPDNGTTDGTKVSDNLLKLLDLANYRVPIDYSMTKSLAVADFFLILFVAAQERVFRKESSAHPGGDNYSIYTSGDYSLRKNNPRYDFVTEQRTFVDYFKIAIFMYGHWVTLIMVLVAGLGGTSLFALGYLILAFWMLWQGNNLYTMKNYRKTLTRWNCLLIYNVVVIFCKIGTQALGCVFINVLGGDAGCVVRQLFSIVCVDKQSADNIVSVYKDSSSCDVEPIEAKIGFDTFAFIFLVFQLRILHSWYFQRCMIDFRCEIVQSSRGALLINQLVEKEMKEQNIQQQAKFDEIRTRTAVIRKQYEEQQKRGSLAAFDAKTYGQDGVRRRRRPLSAIDVDDPFPAYDPRVAEDLVPAKRAGDYYMFNYEPDTDELVAPVESFVPEVTPGAGDFNKLDPAQLLHTAISKDMDLQGTLNAVETAEKIKDEEQRMIKAISEPPEQSQEPAEDGEQEQKEKEESDMITNVLRFVVKMCKSGIEWLTAFLNRLSREHRYVAYVLNMEKVRLKEEMSNELYDINIPMKDFREQWEGRSMHLVSSERDVERLEDEAAAKGLERHFIARFITAVGNCIAAHTDMIAYVIACIAHARCAGLITLPLPALIFFWGTLASPRPSKNFWVTLITYTEFEIVIKFIFQFGFFAWNKPSSVYSNARSPMALPDVFGVQKANYFAFWDVALLIALFFHRYMLRRLGLWKDANIIDTFIEPPSTNPRQLSIEDVEVRTAVEGEITEAIPDEERGVISSFIYKLFHPKFRYIRDLYPLMFFSDVTCFLIVIFGFSSFGDGGSGDVLSDLSSNRVPITFVVLLFIISLMIVVDRGLYLRKAIFWKLIYQLVTVIAIHIWIFFVLPTITKTNAANNTTAQILYVVKCIYFIISAWQIRNGYPQLCIGNLLTHSYGLVNMVLFKVFMACPFLFELRTAIDWTWTDTSMPILDFFSMENFYSVIYNLKCARTFEQSFPAPRGVPKGTIVKYAIGIPLILVIILIIFFPLLAFALLNQIGTFLPPERVQLTLNLEGYPAIYTMEAQGYEIIPFNSNEKEKLKNIVSNSLDDPKYSIIQDDRTLVRTRVRRAVSFIEDFQPKDIYRVKFRPVSEFIWTISGDSMKALQYQFSENPDNGTDVSIRMSANLMVMRERDGSKEPLSQTTSFSLELSPTYPEGVWNGLKEILNVTSGSTSVQVDIPRILPFFLSVPNEGEIKACDALLEVPLRRESPDNPQPDMNETFSTLRLRLSRKAGVDGTMVWDTQADSTEPLRLYKDIIGFDQIKYDTKNVSYIEVIMFVDRIFPDVLGKYAQGGIIAMYVALVLLAGKFIRGMIANEPLDVIINEIPNPDHLLKICLDIYLVREAKDFILEQDMYAKLIFLFRSPATLIKWTRYKPKQE